MYSSTTRQKAPDIAVVLGIILPLLCSSLCKSSWKFFIKLQKLHKMFRKVPFIWASHFPKPLCHWLEKSHFLTPSGSVHLLSVPSPAGNQLAPHHESQVPLLGPWVSFIYNTQARTLQQTIKKLVPLQGPQVCQIIKTTNNSRKLSSSIFELSFYNHARGLLRP